MFCMLTGVNFDYYPEDCDVIIVEPAAEFKNTIEDKFKNVRHKFYYVQGSVSPAGF